MAFSAKRMSIASREARPTLRPGVVAAPSQASRRVMRHPSTCVQSSVGARRARYRSEGAMVAPKGDKKTSKGTVPP